MQAMESIAMLGDTRIYNKIWTRLISAYADDRIAGIRAMGALGNAQARAAIKALLDDEVLEVRLCAAAELGRLGDRSGIQVVKEAFERDLLSTTAIDLGTGPAKGEVAKVIAATAIGQIGSPDLARYLELLLADPSKLVQLAAAKAALQMTGP
jgi:HEAT repeat protein